MKRPIPIPFFESLEPRRLLNAGDLDPTFGNGGIVAESFNGYPGQLIIEPSGKLLVGAGSQLLRLNPNGSFDTTFGSGGAVTTTIGASGMALLPDGKIVVGGSTANGWAVARYNADGTPDDTFGTNGQTITQVSGETAEACVGVGVAANGDIIVGGTQMPTSDSQNPQDANVNEFAAVCFNSDGTLNLSYGTDGDAAGTPSDGATFPLTNAYEATSMEVTPDGSVTVFGGHFDSIATTAASSAFDASGSGDTIGGSQLESDSASALLPDGDVALATTGSFAPSTISFGSSSTALSFNSGVGSNYVFKLYANPTAIAGTTIMLGTSTIPIEYFAAAAFKQDGSPDLSFGTNGMAVDEQYMDLTATASGMTIGGSGNIALAGYYQDDDASAGEAAAVVVFSAGGDLVEDSRGSEFSFYTAVTNSTNGTLVFLDRLPGQAQPSLQFGTSGGSEQIAFGSGAEQRVPGVVVPSPYNQAIVGGDYNNQIGLERFNPDGSPDTTFGPGGAFLFQPSGLPDGASIGLGGVTVEPDGAILVTGDTTTTTGGGGTSTTGFIARFEGTGNAPGSEQPTASLNSSALTPARRRDHYTFRVTYTAQQSIVASTLSNTSVYLTGPRRFSEAATVLNYTVAGNTTVVTYSIDAAASGFPHTKTNFSIVLHKRSIRDSFGQAVPGGALGSFTQALR